MQLSDLVWHVEQGLYRCIKTLPDGSSIDVWRDVHNDAYTIFHDRSFRNSARRCSPDQGMALAGRINSWRGMDALVAQCVLYELFSPHASLKE